MAAVVTGSKTVTQDVSPTMPAATLTTLCATALENMTVAQFDSIHGALKRLSGGGAPGTLIGTLLV